MLALILALPLVGFLINGVFGRRFSAKIAGSIASAAILGAFVISVSKFFELYSMDESSRVIEQVVFQWITVGDFSLPFVLRLDPLSSIMTLVVTGVGFLIHVYSIGYMDHDRTPPKFFAYLNLFSFAMLALVLGGNLPIMFLGWEGVGLCSYLLIGYWYEDDAKASAGKKAFIVNRIGDLGFLVGIFTLFGLFGTLDFVAIKDVAAQNATTVSIATLTFATVCLFIGAMGKSAQFPLYVWLPDAMAGPTPVSALIHAATMVTAGVYMIARMNFLFALCPTTLMIVSGVGAFTALFAATIALAQNDIKKVLAYSTVSQLGYMFMAVGVGAYVAGVFHLVTHAFFKALLFLGSGSVIHGMHEEQDIMKMGGLKKYMPKTFLTFAIGTIAIAGIPPFAGFFSKDEILWNAFSSHHGLAGTALWGVGALTAFLTAFYMTRLT
ncbi:MAG TPA: NADH-quinone oxidoreductase subunit L, partial [Oligoflexia bacterium]|nr:NADH-quinone oxidoreductase subunit L [Oligoflexia bacterium]